MKRLSLEEIRTDGKEPKRFVYLYPDDKHLHPRIHQVEHYTDELTDRNLLEAVVVSHDAFKDICGKYKRLLDEDANVITEEHRREIEAIAQEENFIPDKRGMLLFYHPQANELRGREIRPARVE